MDRSRTTRKKIQKTFYDKKIFKLIKILDFFIFQGLIHEIKNLIVPGSLKKSAKWPISHLLWLYNNFFYTQLAFAFVLQKGFYYAHDDTDTFFIFLLQ